jgi:hypothetical protein
MDRDESYYLRLAEVTKGELSGYYRNKAAEVRESAVQPEIEHLTKQYVFKLRELGVDLPDRVNVQVTAAS